MKRILCCVLAIPLLASSAVALAQTSSTSSSLVGTWNLNRDLSDTSDGPASGDRPARPSGGGGGRRGGFGGGRGGFGGGFGGAGRGGGFGGGDREDMRRSMEAMRDIMTPADRLTIVQTDSMIIVTTGDGRTTRMSPNGKSTKDENTRIERKTKWDGAKLVSEISGVGRGKITETYEVDPEKHQLHLTLSVPDVRGGSQERTITRVYDRADDAAR